MDMDKEKEKKRKYSPILAIMLVILIFFGSLTGIIIVASMSGEEEEDHGSYNPLPGVRHPGYLSPTYLGSYDPRRNPNFWVEDDEGDLAYKGPRIGGWKATKEALPPPRRMR